MSGYQVVKFGSGKYGVTSAYNSFTFFQPPSLSDWLLGSDRGDWWSGPKFVAKYCFMSERRATKWCKKLDQRDINKALAQDKLYADAQVVATIACPVGANSASN